MSRLVDIEDVKDFINGLDSLPWEEVDDLVRAIPTAYDVEKVVAELEEAKKKNFEAYKEATDTFEILCYGNITNAYGDAIDIVKRGGVE